MHVNLNRVEQHPENSMQIAMTKCSSYKNVKVTFCGEEMGRLLLKSDHELALVNQYLLSLVSTRIYFDTKLLHHQLLSQDTNLRRLSI